MTKKIKIDEYQILIILIGLLIVLMLASSIYSLMGFNSVGNAQHEIHAADPQHGHTGIAVVTGEHAMDG